MDELSIYTLLMMIRSFSNEVTVNALADRLGISYSTLARCKNGKWPPSITFDALSDTLAWCRSSFFESDDAMERSVCGYLQRQGIDAVCYERAFEQRGLEAGLNLLLRDAHGDARPSSKSDTQINDAEHQDHWNLEAKTADAAPTVPTVPFMAAALGLPLCLIVLIGLVGVPIDGLFSWLSDHFAAYLAISLALAISPLIAGLFVDAPLAWRAYQHAEPQTSRFPSGLSQLAHVAKLGHPEKRIAGRGRFDMTLGHCTHQLVCNLLGMMCCVSLLFFLESLPEFEGFVASCRWSEFFKAGIVAASFVAFKQLHDLATKPQRVDDDVWSGENPDNYLLDRAHVWANAAHLVWTLSLVGIFTIALLAYSFANFRSQAASPLILWPLGQTVAFLWFSCLSPVASRTETVNLGSFVPGVGASCIGVAALSLVCYQLEWPTIAVAATSLAALVVSLSVRNFVLKRSSTEWLRSGSASKAYSIAITCSILALSAIGLATSSLAG